MIPNACTICGDKAVITRQFNADDTFRKQAESHPSYNGPRFGTCIYGLCKIHRWSKVTEVVALMLEDGHE